MLPIKHSPALYLSELLNEKDLLELLNRYPIGLELIHFSISDNLDHLDRSIYEFQKVLNRLGNPSLTLHGPFLDLNPMAYDNQIRRVTMERFCQAYLAARELGAQKIVYHSGMIPSVYLTMGWAERIADFWNEFFLHNHGIPVCMENVLDQKIDPILEVARRVPHNDFGLCLDVGHANCYSNHKAEEWAAALKPYLRHLHLHDNHGQRDEHNGIGNGSICWKELFKTLSPFDTLTMTVECADKKAAEQSLSYLLQSKDIFPLS